VHLPRHPAHITLRRAAQVSSLRNHRAFVAVRGAISKGSRSSFRVIHFSVQRDHIHLIVEGTDRISIARGVQGLCVRIARAVNRVLGRDGEVFGDRYHRRDLATPREVRNAIAYVLLNWEKHHPQSEGGVDYFSSGAWFDGWVSWKRVPDTPSPVVLARTWLAQCGWRRHGLLKRPDQI
jgi:REP element-mobilizing transposase RayT